MSNYGKCFSFCLTFLSLFIFNKTASLSYAGNDAEKTSFSVFQQINLENYKAIQSGQISIQRTKEIYTDKKTFLQDVQNQKAQHDSAIQQIRNNSRLSEKEKEQGIAFLERNYPLLLKQKNLDVYQSKRTEITNETFHFDVARQQYRRDEDRLDSQTLSSIDKKIKITNKDSQIEFVPSLNVGALSHFKLPFGADLPAYLGIIPRYKLNTTIIPEPTFAQVDGHDVIVYEVPAKYGTRKMYVDPKIGYKFRRMEFLVDGKVVEEEVAKDYRFIGDIPFPTIYEKTSYTNDPDRPIREKIVIRVIQAELNQQLKPEVFHLTCNSETRIQEIGSHDLTENSELKPAPVIEFKPGPVFDLNSR